MQLGKIDLYLLSYRRKRSRILAWHFLFAALENGDLPTGPSQTRRGNATAVSEPMTATS